jgi:hypothetical protein
MNNVFFSFGNAREPDHHVVGITAEDRVDIAAVKRVFRALHDFQRFIPLKSILLGSLHPPHSCIGETKPFKHLLSAISARGRGRAQQRLVRHRNRTFRDRRDLADFERPLA